MPGANLSPLALGECRSTQPRGGQVGCLRRGQQQVVQHQHGDSMPSRSERVDATRAAWRRPQCLSPRRAATHSMPAASTTATIFLDWYRSPAFATVILTTSAARWHMIFITSSGVETRLARRDQHAHRYVHLLHASEQLTGGIFHVAMRPAIIGPWKERIIS